MRTFIGAHILCEWDPWTPDLSELFSFLETTSVKPTVKCLHSAKAASISFRIVSLPVLTLIPILASRS